MFEVRVSRVRDRGPLPQLRVSVFLRGLGRAAVVYLASGRRHSAHHEALAATCAARRAPIDAGSCAPASDAHVHIQGSGGRPRAGPSAATNPGSGGRAAGACHASIEYARAPSGRRRRTSIDLFLLLAVDLVVVYFTMQICGVALGELALLPKGPLVVFLLVQNVGYLVAFTVGGQTLGKMAAGIKVVAGDCDAALDVPRALKRTVMSLLLAIPGGLGLLPTLFDREHRGLHDRFAGTRVVRKGRRGDLRRRSRR